MNYTHCGWWKIWYLVYVTTKRRHRQGTKTNCCCCKWWLDKSGVIWTRAYDALVVVCMKVTTKSKWGKVFQRIKCIKVLQDICRIQGTEKRVIHLCQRIAYVDTSTNSVMTKKTVINCYPIFGSFDTSTNELPWKSDQLNNIGNVCERRPQRLSIFFTYIISIIT